ncbi:MAG: type III-B CRISPR module RAMP protein Cmr1 [Bacteroidia bacterium]
MESITFTCKIITPMFLNGADGKTPELRPPSIKGALRFWWRAVNGHLGLGELRKMETEIFGGTGPGGVGGQAEPGDCAGGEGPYGKRCPKELFIAS